MDMQIDLRFSNLKITKLVPNNLNKDVEYPQIMSSSK
jgi:hypothetical protein